MNHCVKYDQLEDEQAGFQNVAAGCMAFHIRTSKGVLPGQKSLAVITWLPYYPADNKVVFLRIRQFTQVYKCALSLSETVFICSDEKSSVFQYTFIDNRWC